MKFGMVRVETLLTKMCQEKLTQPYLSKPLAEIIKCLAKAHLYTL